ncbi:catechol 2,3-dioxygenase-like lactoylglutathione lyase family enzyme [Bradyrhizobium embrapense]
MSKALNLHHAWFGTPDLERQIAYYEEVMGLRIVSRENGRAYLATRSGTDAIILSAQNRTLLNGIAFLTQPERSAQDTLRDLRSRGLNAEIRTDPHPGVAVSVNFVDPNGFNVELIGHDRFHAPGPVRGVAPLRLGHLSILVPDVSATANFYMEILGFRVGDWVGDFFVFLRCNHQHHTINFIRSDHARMHHIAFEMPDSSSIVASCDVLAGAKRELLWGPVRHGPGHNIATYHKNPEGQIVELYAEMDLMTHEALGYYDPRPWHSDYPQKPKVWSTEGPRRDVWGPFPPHDFLKQGV